MPDDLHDEYAQPQMEPMQGRTMSGGKNKFVFEKGLSLKIGIQLIFRAIDAVREYFKDEKGEKGEKD